MKTKTYMLCVCLVVAVAFSLTTQHSSAQTTRPATRPVQTQSLPTTGGPAVQTEATEASGTTEKSETATTNDAKNMETVAAQRAAKREANGTPATNPIKVFRAEFTNWLQNTPGAKEQLNATERELYQNNDWVKLYEYRNGKTPSTN